MSLPGATIEQLAAENDRLKSEVEDSMRVDYWAERFRDAQKEIDRLHDSIERQKDAITSLQLSNETLMRRVESLELERGEPK